MESIVDPMIVRTKLAPGVAGIQLADQLDRRLEEMRPHLRVGRARLGSVNANGSVVIVKCRILVNTIKFRGILVNTCSFRVKYYP